MDNRDQIEKDLKNLFLQQRLGVLATQTNGQPYTSLVAFTSSEDLKWLYFSTTRSTRKYANLSKDSRVSMLIDNRSNKPSDLKWAKAATATGHAWEADFDTLETIKALHLAKHPYLKDFVESPSCAVIRFKVKTYFLVSRFQNVIEIHMEQ